MSLHGGLKRPLCEAVMRKPGLPRGPQDAGDARVIEFLPRGTADWVWSWLGRQMCVSVNKPETSWGFEEYFDIGHGDVEFGVCLAGFWSCIRLVFPHCIPLSPFWNDNVFPTLLYVASIWSAVRF